MTVEDFAAFPRGTFALVLDLGKAGLAEGSGRIDLATDVNATSELKSTAPISTTAPAAVADETASSRGGSVQAAIQAAWPEVGPVAVSRFRAEEPTRRHRRARPRRREARARRARDPSREGRSGWTAAAGARCCFF